MSESRVLDVLRQVEAGDLTPEEADRVLSGLGVGAAEAEPPSPEPRDGEVGSRPAWASRLDRRAERARSRLERHRARLERRLSHERERRERVFRRLGSNYTVDHLIRLRLHGISQDYVEEMGEAGYEELSPEELVELRIHGVTPEYVSEMREVLGDVPVDKMTAFKIHGVTPELVEDLREAGVESPTPDDVLRWRNTTRGSRIGDAVNQAMDVVAPHVSQLVETALAEARQRIYEALRVNSGPPEEWRHVDTRPGVPEAAARPPAPPRAPKAPKAPKPDR